MLYQWYPSPGYFYMAYYLVIGVFFHVLPPPPLTSEAREGLKMFNYKKFYVLWYDSVFFLVVREDRTLWLKVEALDARLRYPVCLSRSGIQ